MATTVFPRREREEGERKRRGDGEEEGESRRKIEERDESKDEG